MDVWYAAYGSNLSAARFACYLQGGRPPGAARTYSGCRDTTPPRDDRPLVLPGRLIFGWHSPVWGGGIAFYDADPDSPDGPGVYARAYRISEQQFADVAAQEMHRAPGADLDLAEVLAAGRHVHGPGRYETLHAVGELDGCPVLTFTAADPAALERTAPAPAYLMAMTRGLRESHGLDNAVIAAYLPALHTPQPTSHRSESGVKSARGCGVGTDSGCNDR